MNTVREKIGLRLKGSSELMNLLDGGVHYGFVLDQSLNPPFCIFHFEPGNGELWTMGDSSLDEVMLVVKGVAESLEIAESIDLVARQLLDNSELGAPFKFARRTSLVSYEEIKDGRSYYYRGSKYKVTTEES